MSKVSLSLSLSLYIYIYIYISQVRVFEAGQDLVTEGRPAESFFMVEEGSLELTRRRFKAPIKI